MIRGSAIAEEMRIKQTRQLWRRSVKKTKF